MILIKQKPTYIRTKDGRISYLSREPNEEITDYEIITSKGTITYRREDEVIKVANNIPELCDEFVYLMESGKHICKEKHTDILYVFDNDEPIAYYGAIWTDKGLIYVAKMNEKGELELI